MELFAKEIGNCRERGACHDKEQGIVLINGLHERSVADDHGNDIGPGVDQDREEEIRDLSPLHRAVNQIRKAEVQPDRADPFQYGPDRCDRKCNGTARLWKT